MKMRLTAGRSAAGAALLVVSVSACSGGGSSIPATFTPSPATPSVSSTAAGGSRTPSPNQGSTGSQHASGTGTSAGQGSGAGKTSAPAKTSAPVRSSTARPTKKAVAPAKTPAPTKTVRPRPSATLAHVPPPVPTRYPAVAPETGGGGTAGLQDGVLFGAGGAAILVGLASLAYRRRLSRNGRTAD